MFTAAMLSMASTSLRSWLCQITAPGAMLATKASPLPASAPSNAATSSSLLGMVLLRRGSADVETFGGGRHLVQELATPPRVGSTCHVAEVLDEDEAVDAEVFVATHGVGVDRSGQRRDRDLELPELRGSVDLVGQARELVHRGLGGVEVLEEAVPALAALDPAPTSGGREAAGDDR